MLFGGAPSYNAPTQNRRRQILGRLQQRAMGPASQNPLYQTGMGELNDQLDDRRQDDEAAAAARGLTGSEFEVAQGQNRMEALAQGQRGLLGQAAQMQQRDLGQLMSGMQQQDANFWRKRELKNRRRQQILGALGQAAGSAAMAFGE